MIFSYLNHVFVLFLIAEYPTYQMDGTEGLMNEELCENA